MQVSKSKPAGKPKSLIELMRRDWEQFERVRGEVSKKTLNRLLSKFGKAWYSMPAADQAPLIRAEALVVMARMGVL